MTETTSPPKLLSGARVLVTGASGLVALPVVRELARDNEVFAVARWSNPAQRKLAEEAGATAIACDIATRDLSALPGAVDVVINFAVLPPGQPQAYEVNIAAAGRLARHYRQARAFVHGSTGSAYHYQGERALREDDPYGLHAPIESYSASKIAAEYLLRHLSEDYGLPLTIMRIFSFYGPRGGAVAERIDAVARGRPVSVYPGVRNVYTPLFEDDYVAKTIAAAGIAAVGGEVVNVAGTEPVTIEDYCRMAGEVVGREPVFVDNGRSTPLWADTTRMLRLLGPNKVSMREGVARVIAAGGHPRVTTAHDVAQPR